jgi:rod shape-determining protein MreD
LRRFLTLSLTQLLLWALVSELNHLLSGLRVHVFAGALFVTFAALTQPRRSGLFAVCVGGLICDATSPVGFGHHLLLFVAAHGILFHLRERMPHDDNIALTVVTLLANLGLFLAFSFTQMHLSPSPAAVWPRLLMDLACSQVFLSLVTPWLFALQGRALELAQVVTAAYDRRLAARRF